MARVDGVPIVVAKDGRSATLERVTFQPKGGSDFDEAWLQRLIHRHPDTLPLTQIEPGFALPIAVCMEFPTKHGPIDNVLV